MIELRLAYAGGRLEEKKIRNNLHICACFANQMPLEKRGNYAQYVLLLEEEKLR